MATVREVIPGSLRPGFRIACAEDEVQNAHGSAGLQRYERDAITGKIRAASGQD